MSIFPLPVFEADADPTRRSVMTDAEIYARLKPPSTIVVRVGRMKLVAEYPHHTDAKPGCGSKLVARTHRGTEIVEMLTTTCSNSGCGKSVSRSEMLEYIENSGGREYPFHTDGQILRVATIDDLNLWSQTQSRMHELVKIAKAIVEESGLPMKVVDLEPIFGQELLTVYFLSEERIDFRELVRELANAFKTRIEMRQVGARDEARLVADYERCGQHCCCKNFLKVLKPVSMRSAKVQKATLDPLKISGRCGRLMCCLRYEDETYEDLKSRLPKSKTRVGTSEGPGIVIDGKILVQLVLVKLEHDGSEIAVPVEELLDPNECPQPPAQPPLPPPRPSRPSRLSRQDASRDVPSGASSAHSTAPSPVESPKQPPAAPAASDPLRGLSPQEVERRISDRDRRDRGQRPRDDQQDAFRASSEAREPSAEPALPAEGAQSDGSASPARERKRRRRRRRRGDGAASGGESGGAAGGDDDSPDPPSQLPSQPPSQLPTDQRPSDGQVLGDASTPDSPAAGGGKRRRRRRGRGRKGDGPAPD